MDNLKKISLAIIAFGSSVALAGAMGPVCVEGGVTVPCPHLALDIGVQALYLHQASSNAVFFTKHANPANITNWYGINSTWDWGSKLEGSYHFRTGNDININKTC